MLGISRSAGTELKRSLRENVRERSGRSGARGEDPTRPLKPREPRYYCMILRSSGLLSPHDAVRDNEVYSTLQYFKTKKNICGWGMTQ